MLKRPLEDTDGGSPAKKKCTMSLLDSMKSDLEKLLKNAEEHHENARLEAVDAAFDLEEELKSAQKRKEDTEKELAETDEQLDKVTQYLDTFENSSAVKMLKKAAECSVELAQLNQDYSQVKEKLEAFRSMRSTLVEKCDTLKHTLSEHSSKCDELTKKHTSAEEKADTISSLN